MNDEAVFTLDFTRQSGGKPATPKTPATPYTPSNRRGSTALRRAPGRRHVENAEEALGKQAASILGDPELATAKESVIRKRAKERIEALKVELQTGLIGPMQLDQQFGPIWALAHAPKEQPLEEVALY
ncbi:hypothetical protein AB1Y20_006662 [Prymnesium parvum]|uniref:Uncharacterized protein n=1 Tax=Prymnesium parvum TaxID=97485 RepID=A0AB34IZH7_PRYPA|mmetsp:Transcript_49584/g.123246  ORF Transcript_49584/g.123246 Transcript_49584/m.123246 type:complete len:128 (-) Transcript_49584:513-896(-)|eukprot:CAMPEP_0182824338 /NCGR_PEP_ID=MMETSP0006_2-20121128/15238_1 /TAXON_ID=97485 /ORGANISM="Prymnesium parvum, Strain Texoma1" /LENGTH=127 /DNA_ID=CAMNT_0024951331 /DNA_START=306 /DNA_END=689 /DNA_ORIENTATION=+